MQADLTCSKDAKWPTYYLDTTTGKWEIEDSKHQPGTLSSVYRTTEKTGGIPGEITATGAFDNIEATISRQCPSVLLTRFHQPNNIDRYIAFK